ncbi:MAG: rhomboid family intramembrane serine protease [Planctomycetota bacterium]|jgi:rhomboid protease GluP|nr:rhomboid family intramembrane serine protease [Planctomycetota bacterium]
MADWYFRGSEARGGPGICPGCRRLVRKGDEFCPFCARRIRAESGWRAHAKALLATPDIATRGLLGLILLIFILQYLVAALLPPEYRDGGTGGFFGSAPGALLLMGGSSAGLVFGLDQWWRLVSYIFLHANLLHIFFNCWMFWDIGRLVERTWGARQTFAAFILTGIAAGLASAVLGQLSGSRGITVGASGSICGLLGLLIGAEYRLGRRRPGTFFESGLVRNGIYIIVFGLIVPGVDNAAHLGGLLSGSLLGYCLPPSGLGRSRDRTVWKVAAVCSLVLLIGSASAAGHLVFVELLS